MLNVHLYPYTHVLPLIRGSILYKYLRKYFINFKIQIIHDSNISFNTNQSRAHIGQNKGEE